MSRRQPHLGVLGLLAAGLLVAPAVVGHVVAQTPRVIRFEITPPVKDVPKASVATHEGEAATMSVPDLGTFAFQPTLGDDHKTVVVVIFDEGSQPHHRLGEVRATIGGPVAQSKTTPTFGVRILQVTEPKTPQGAR
jgi:hypothetical protein